MSLIKKLQTLANTTATTTVRIESIGDDIELKALHLSQRLELYNKDSPLNNCSFAMVVVALSVCEKGQRLVDKLDAQEVIAFLEPIPIDEFTELYTAAAKLSGISKAEQEEAEKNSKAPTE
ncbi:hypothetical protein [Neptunicella sp.]|uniref:hypothetical protein n=1 Tax=Neptunicella sp. TaxID=2125986 RepID=UPI003F68EEA1